MNGRRAPRGTLSRQRVIEAARALVAEKGFDALNMRSLAERLGVAPMSLYRHVAGKEEVVAELVDGLIAARWRPSGRERQWERWVVAAADRLRALLVEEPAVLATYLSRPVASPAAVERMERMVAVLTTGLGSKAAARRAYAIIHTFTLGFATLQAARSRSQHRPSGQREAELASFTTDAQFRKGLETIIAGLKAGDKSS